jgi:copper(I)-binding protein
LSIKTAGIILLEKLSMFRTTLLRTVLFSMLSAGVVAQPALLFAAGGQMQDNMKAMFKPVTVGGLEITAAAIKAMTPGQPVGGGFVTIVNKGRTDDRLVSVSIAEGVRTVELHEMAMKNDVMTMRKLADGIPVPAGQTVEMKPGGLHMMIMGVSRPFKAGESVRATLVFEKAGKVDLDIPVRDMRPGMKNMKM